MSVEDRGARALAESGSLRKLGPADRTFALAERAGVVGIFAAFATSDALRSLHVGLVPRALASVGAASIASKAICAVTSSALEDRVGEIDRARVNVHLGLDAILFPLAGGLALVFSDNDTHRREGALLLGTAALAGVVTVGVLQK